MRTTFLRWWETLGRPERIVAMSLAAGGVVAIANSTTWAVAVCYMSRQKALVAMRAPLASTATDAVEGGHAGEVRRGVLDAAAAESGRAVFAQ